MKKYGRICWGESVTVYDMPYILSYNNHCAIFINMPSRSVAELYITRPSRMTSSVRTTPRK